MADFQRQSKEMVFNWCKSDQHDKCRKQYGGGRIVCSCDCNPEVHGTNYKPISKAMTEEEVKASIASLNEIMVGDAGDGVSENRAVMSSSPIWGDQVKEGNKSNTYANTGSSSYNTKPGYNSSYYYTEKLDAATIEELEERRGTGSARAYEYDSFDAWL